MMRTLLVVPWDQEFGGVASVVGNLARYLQGQKHRVIFLHPTKSFCLRKKTTKWGFQAFGLGLIPPLAVNRSIRCNLAFLFLFPTILCQLIYIIRKYRIQIVNVHYPLDNSIYFAICRRLLPIRLITSIHGADFFPGGSPRARYSGATKFLLLTSDRVIAPSRAFLNDLLAIFPTIKEKATFIHNGVNISELNKVYGDVSAHKDRYLLSIAACNKKKGLDILLQAFAQLKDWDPSIRLLLAGDGPLRRELESLAIALGIYERVEFLGRVGRTQIARLLHECEVFVLSSRSEPFGIAIIEALACKKPVVACAVGGIPEIIENGKSGILVEPDNPNALAKGLLIALRNQALRKSLAGNGYLTVQRKFRWENTGAAYAGVFDDLLHSAN